MLWHVAKLINHVRLNSKLQLATPSGHKSSIQSKPQQQHDLTHRRPDT